MADKDRFGRSERAYSGVTDSPGSNRRRFGRSARQYEQDKFLNRLAGMSVTRGPRGNYLRYPGEDNPDLRYDAEYNLETSVPFGVFPQALSRGLPSVGLQKYLGMMEDPAEKEKQDLIRQGLEMQPEFSAYPLTTSDVGDIAFRTGDTGMYSTDDIEPYYGQPTEGTMGRANPFVQELTGTGDIPLYDVRTPQDIAYEYRSALPRGAHQEETPFKQPYVPTNPITDSMNRIRDLYNTPYRYGLGDHPGRHVGFYSRGGIASLRR